MKRFIYFFVLLIFFTSCKKEVESNWYTIEIRSSSNFDCHIPEITFLTGGDEVKQLLGSDINIFVATGLPKVLFSPGTQLSVKIKKPETNDFIACTTLGPSYPQVVITEIK